uniref:Uncharacterized protein n=1 Tax=Cucumis melo TaxID=3656 RepID=A0A9I9EJ92_CUCME
MNLLFNFSSPQSPPSSTLSCVDRCGKMERDEKKMVEDGMEKMIG